MKLKHLLLALLFPITGLAQDMDLPSTPETTMPDSVNRVLIEYKKPKLFSFLTDIPKDVAGFTKQSFSKKNLPNLAIVAGTTGILLVADQFITNSIQHSCSKKGIHASENFTPFISVKIAGKKTNLGKIPLNINTAFYNLGQGSATMLIAGGLFVWGEIKHNNRALQTAKQLTQAFIALGLGTQIMKYSTGRENPSDATARGGKWQPFPSWSNFQNNKPRYDAYPSGHLATLVSTVTILAQNYPEKKWIAPVGYSIAGLCGLAMINNGVHWSSDFPLGIALGYGFGKFISRKSHFILVQ